MKAFWQTVKAVAIKECLHTLRDKLTLALLITVPLVQFLLFGFAIDLHPRHLPTVLIAQEDDAFTQRAVEKIESLGYFKIAKHTKKYSDAELWLAQSKVQFAIELPASFGRKILLGEKPTINLIADATDPIASIVAVQSVSAGFQRTSEALPVLIKTQLAFNPSAKSNVFVIPGLIGVILTLTLVLLGSLSIVREQERGTLEHLTGINLSPSALLLGKVAPYFAIGCIMYIVLLLLCISLTGLPWPGWSAPLFLIAFLFIATNLMLGMMLSLIAKNTMQAMQLGIFFYLPSMLLSGFMFPFYGMPNWAQSLGELLPLTHFLRLVRGILIKGLKDVDAWIFAWPILFFGLLTAILTSIIYRIKKKI
jgi:ABC-2 type transport system permease protein